MTAFNNKFYSSMLGAIALLVLVGCGSTGSIGADNDAASRPIDTTLKIQRVIEVLDAQLAAPVEKRIASSLLNNAQCMVVIPDLVQGGLGVGFKHGNGVVACRHDADGTWGAPAFVRLSGASVGALAGIQRMDVMMLAMTENGLNQLLAGKPIASGEAGVTIGPVGRNAEVAMDVLLQTPLLSYTRSTGLYAGASLGGSLFTTARKVNGSIYGQYESARELLLEHKVVPTEMQGLVDVLNRYAPFDK